MAMQHQIHLRLRGNRSSGELILMQLLHNLYKQKSLFIRANTIQILVIESFAFY